RLSKPAIPSSFELRKWPSSWIIATAHSTAPQTTQANSCVIDSLPELYAVPGGGAQSNEWTDEYQANDPNPSTTRARRMNACITSGGGQDRTIVSKSHHLVLNIKSRARVTPSIRCRSHSSGSSAIVSERFSRLPVAEMSADRNSAMDAN